MLVIFFRSIILVTCVLIALRILGKRQIGELETSEFVVTLVISDLASVPMQNIGTPLLHGIIPILTMVGLQFLITFGILKSIRFRTLMSGKPSIVIQEGEIKQSELKKSRLTIDELLEELRTQDVLDLSTVKYAILETGGDLSVIKYADLRTVTVKDMGIHTEEKGLPIILISDGRYLDENIEIRNITRKWVDNYLIKNKLPDHKGIYLMTLDESGKVYISLKERNR